MTLRLSNTVLVGLTLLAACDRPIAPRSLQNEQSSFRLKTNAPVSELHLAHMPGSSGAGIGESSFAPPPAPASTFRAAEVAADRMAATTALISELHATQAADRSIVVELPSDVLFDFDKANLRPDGETSLVKTADLITSYPDAPLAVQGHSDGKGSQAYNLPLSERRARAVADWLKKRTGRTPEAKGYGELKPVEANTRANGSDNPEGRQRNRRVEIVIRPLAAVR